MLKVNCNLIKVTYCSCKHNKIYSQQKYIQFLIINVVIKNIIYTF